MRRAIWIGLLLPILIAISACGGAPASTAPADNGGAAASTGEVEAPSAGDSKVAAAVSLGEFSSAGKLGDRRTDHRAVLLPDGRVMVIGGRGFGPGDWGPPRHETAEIHDPATGLWSGTGGMAKKRQAHTADLLEDGRVFVTGGQDQQNYHKKTELWDPATGSWSPGPKMSTPRWIHTSARLDNDTVLVVGGNNDLFGLVGDAELYDPVSSTFSPAGTMIQKRAEHTMTVLNDGKVLVVGGGKGGLGQEATTFDSAETWDAATNEWSSAGTLSVGRAQHTATLLNDGRVLVTGSKGKIETAEIYDPASGEWSLAGSMSEWRAVHTATLLSDGRVMVAGGIGDIASTEFFDPATGEWSLGATMTIPRYGHTATLLDDGRVLFVGGNTMDSDGIGTLTNTAEIYEP